jgi:hypothetical protein
MLLANYYYTRLVGFAGVGEALKPPYRLQLVPMLAKDRD